MDLAYRTLTDEQRELIKNILSIYSPQDWSIGKYKYKQLEEILKENIYHILTDRIMLNDLRQSYINHIKRLSKNGS